MGVGYTLGPPRGYRRGAELPGDLGPEGDTHSSDFLEPEVLSLMPKLGGAPTESGGGFVEEAWWREKYPQGKRGEDEWAGELWQGGQRGTTTGL